MEANVKQRLYWVDALKAIAIFFVVLGHIIGSFLFGQVSGSTWWFMAYVASFHMPVFFFVSGFLLKEEELNNTFLTYLGKRFRSLVIPYFVFAFLTYVPWVLVTRHYGYQRELDISPLTPFLGIFYGTLKDNWLLHNGPLWFLACLFVTQVGFYWIGRLRSQHLIVVMLAICAILAYLDYTLTSFRSPWSTDVALTAVVFYGVGYLGRNNPLLIHKPKAMGAVLILVTCVCLQALSIKFSPGSIMGARIYGNYGFFLLGGLSGIMSWVIVTKYMPFSRLISRIGKDAVVILCLQDLAFSFITGVAVWVFSQPLDFAEGSIFVALLYTVGSIAILLPVAYVLRRYARWLIGGR